MCSGNGMNGIERQIVFCVSDTKNSSGIVGNVEEIAHTAVQFYWNPTEAPVKVRKTNVICGITVFYNKLSDNLH